jgi:hypothetical protein
MRIPVRSNLPHLFSHAKVLRLTLPLTEMSIRNLPGGKGRPGRKADLSAICESFVCKIWEPQYLTTVQAFTACYRDSFGLLVLSVAETMQLRTIYRLVNRTIHWKGRDGNYRGLMWGTASPFVCITEANHENEIPGQQATEQRTRRTTKIRSSDATHSTGPYALLR